MLNEIRAINCGLAKDLYKLLRKRIEERRTVYSLLLNFFKNLDINLIRIKDLRFAKGPEKKNLDNSISDEENPKVI